MKASSDSLAQKDVLKSAFGPYRLVGEIGRGGMATAFLAVFANGDGTARPAVLKQLHPYLASDRDFRTMFEDEARLSTRLHHENVVETFDVYCDPDLCVLLMEFLEGQTLSGLRQTAHRMGNLPLPIQLHCLAQVLAGLDYVHELPDERGNPLRVVHRDVTPSNVLVTYDGRVKVLDFGIAKASTRMAVTRVGVLKGKLGYMSPEAARGEPVDRRTDIFSVGVMLWEAVAGRRLWQDHDDVTVLQRLAAGHIPLRPRELAISDPAAFDIAERALASDPNRRYPTAAAMRRDIEGLLAHRGTTLGASALSGYMRTCFAEEREKLRALVEEAPKSDWQPVSSGSLLDGDLVEDVTALEETEPPTTVSLPQAPLFRTITFPGTPPAPTRAHFPSPGVWLAAGSAALAIAVAFFAHLPRAIVGRPTAPPVASAAGAAAIVDLTRSLPQRVAPSSITPSVAAAPNPSVAPSSVAPSADVAANPVTASTNEAAPIDADREVAPPTVTLMFSARPPEARFSLDGERLEGNPVTLRRPQDDKVHRLRIEAPGFLPFSRAIHLDEDKTRVFDLVRKPPPPPTAHTPHPAEAAPATSTDCPLSRQKRAASESAETPR